MVGFASAANTAVLVAASAALKVLKTSSFLISLIVVLPCAVQTIETLESPARNALTGCFSTPSCLDATSFHPAAAPALMNTLLIDYKIRQRLAATQQHHALIALALANAAVMFHLDFTGQQLDLAGAAHALRTRCRQAHARFLGRFQHMLRAAAFDLAIALGKADLERGLYRCESRRWIKADRIFARLAECFAGLQRIGHVSGRQLRRDFRDRLEGEAFFVVVRGVETAFREQIAHRFHIGRRTAGKDFPFEKIRCDQLEQRQRKKARHTRPVGALADSFAYERRPEISLVRRNQIEFAREDDVVGSACAVQEHDVAILAELVVR